jgi:hypothetical protein
MLNTVKPVLKGASGNVKYSQAWLYLTLPEVPFKTGLTVFNITWGVL